MSYVYAYLDPRKPVNISACNYEFNYMPFYIGKGTDDRKYKHLYYLDCDSNRKKANKILKIIDEGYNVKDFIIEMKTDMDDAESFDLEIKFIRELKFLGVDLCNLSDGGEGQYGFKHSDETKALLSRMFSGEKNPAFGRDFKFSNETLLKMKQSQIQRTLQSDYVPPMFGKLHSDEWKSNHSIMLKEHYQTHDIFNKDKTYDELYGVEKSIKMKANQSNFMKLNNPMNSTESRMKISKQLTGEKNPASKYKYSIEHDGIVEHTYSLGSFAKSNNLKCIGLRAACDGCRLYKGKYFIRKELR